MKMNSFRCSPTDIFLTYAAISYSKDVRLLQYSSFRLYVLFYTVNRVSYGACDFIWGAFIDKDLINESTIRTRKFRKGQDFYNVFKMWDACRLLQLYSHLRIEKFSNRYVKTLITNFACDCMAIVIKAEFRSFPLSYHQIKLSAYYRNTPKKN